MTFRPVMRSILRHLKFVSDPPSVVEVRIYQYSFAWASS